MFNRKNRVVETYEPTRLGLDEIHDWLTDAKHWFISEKTQAERILVLGEELLRTRNELAEAQAESRRLAELLNSEILG